jgi:hypothetical protein
MTSPLGTVRTLPGHLQGQKQEANDKPGMMELRVATDEHRTGALVARNITSIKSTR